MNQINWMGDLWNIVKYHGFWALERKGVTVSFYENFANQSHFIKHLENKEKELEDRQPIIYKPTNSAN